MAGKDLAGLVRHGLLGTRGGGPSTSYVFAAKVAPQGAHRSGRPTTWTDAVIETELRAFLDGRSS